MNTDTSFSSQASDDFVHISRSLLAYNVDDIGTIIAQPTPVAEAEPDVPCNCCVNDHPIKEEHEEVGSFCTDSTTLVDAELDALCDCTTCNDSLKEESPEPSPEPIPRPAKVESTVGDAPNFCPSNSQKASQQGPKKVLVKSPVKKPMRSYRGTLMARKDLLKAEILRTLAGLDRAQGVLDWALDRQLYRDL